MLFLFSILLTFISLSALAFDPKIGILVTLVLKPIIDTTWDNVFFGMKLTYAMGVGVPILIGFHALLNLRGEGFSKMPLFLLWLIYVLWNFIAVQTIIYNAPLRGVEIFFRTLNGFIGFYMFQRYFRQKEDFKKLLIALMLAGLFPIGVGVYQLVTGHVWKAWLQSGVERNIGLYHDHATLKYYFFQTIAAILLYWSYCTKKTEIIKNVFLLTYFACCVPVLYKLYVKSGNIAFGMWMLIWSALQKKILLLGLCAITILLANIYLENRLLDEMYKVYDKEISVLTGELPADRSFAGRWGLWKAWYNDWKKRSTLSKFFGSGLSGYRLHNDYIFVLVRSGIIGLLCYLALLVAIGGSLFIGLLRGITPLRVVALMVFCLWLVDAIGLVPSGYPAFQWFAWGIIGLALRLDKSDSSWSLEEKRG